MVDGRHLKKSEIGHIIDKCLTDLHEIWHGDVMALVINCPSIHPRRQPGTHIFNH